MHTVRPIILVLLFLQSRNISAQSTSMDFSPNGYLSEKFAQTPATAGHGVTVTEVNIGGGRFTRYAHEQGALYVERLERLDADPKVFLDCKSYLDNPKERVEHRIALEKEITASVSIDLTLVSDVIISRCDGRIHGMTPSVNPLELGVRIKKKGGGSYRIFNRMLQPNLGFQTEF